ncbi:MAG: DUF1330 domain-containing protein [Desulfocapsaceae bacterium]
MSVFFVISTSEIVDHQRYDDYVRQARPIVESYGGEYLLQSDKVIASKDWQTKKIVIIKFSSKEQLDQCFQSDEYKAIIPLREGSIVSRFVMVES